jgi:hypothetical protein
MKEERMARLETMIQQHKELRCNPVWGWRRQPAPASEDKAGDRSYVWDAQRHFMRLVDKLMSWR